jgi:hypothetical protein
LCAKRRRVSVGTTAPSSPPNSVRRTDLSDAVAGKTPTVNIASSAPSVVKRSRTKSSTTDNWSKPTPTIETRPLSIETLSV